MLNRGLFPRQEKKQSLRGGISRALKGRRWYPPGVILYSHPAVGGKLQLPSGGSVWSRFRLDRTVSRVLKRVGVRNDRKMGKRYVYEHELTVTFSRVMFPSMPVSLCPVICVVLGLFLLLSSSVRLPFVLVCLVFSLGHVDVLSLTVRSSFLACPVCVPFSHCLPVWFSLQHLLP